MVVRRGLPRRTPARWKLHQPLDGANTRDLAVQLAPDLAGAVDAEVLGMDLGDLDLQLGVADRTS